MMNERIFELAEQAGFQNGHQDRDGRSLSDELEKFAELIVKECILISRTSTDGFGAGKRMEEHFGIEE